LFGKGQDWYRTDRQSTSSKVIIEHEACFSICGTAYSQQISTGVPVVGVLSKVRDRLVFVKEWMNDVTDTRTSTDDNIILTPSPGMSTHKQRRQRAAGAKAKPVSIACFSE
jgi:hypothetical protein